MHILEGHKIEVASVAISPDGRYLLTGEGIGGGGANPVEARLWDAATGRHLFSFKGHLRAIPAVAFNPDGTRCLTTRIVGDASKFSAIKLWDTKTGRELLSIRAPRGEFQLVKFSPNGRFIVSAGGTYRDISLWDATSGELARELRGHAHDIADVGFSADGAKVFAWTTSGVCHSWAVEDGSPVALDGAIGASIRLQNGPFAVSPDRKYWAATYRGDLMLIDLHRNAAQNTWLRLDAERRQRLHADLARDAEGQKRWFAAAFHIARLLLDDPDNADLKKRRQQALQDHAAVIDHQMR